MKQTEKVISEINYAMSVLSRLRDHLGKKELRTIAYGLIMSKIRYCLPVFAGDSLRLQETDPQSSLMHRIQRVQNDMLRVVMGKKLKDRARVSEMLEDTGFLSVNQTAAYSLLIETWKARQFNVPILSGLLERKRKDNRTLRSDSANKVATIGYDSVLGLHYSFLWPPSDPNWVLLF